MKLEDFEQIKENLDAEYNENCSKMHDLNEKIRLLDINKFEMKVRRIIGFSLIFWLISLGILVFPSVVIPLNLIRPLFIFSPILIGIISEELFTKVMKFKKKLNNISNSKTERDKLEEEIRCEIEFEKLKNLNKILKNSHNSLSENEKMISNLSKNYNIKEKDVLTKTKEEITKDIKNLNDILESENKKLDILTTKCVLKDNFKDIRNKYYLPNAGVYAGVAGGLLLFYIYGFIPAVINAVRNILISPSFIELFLSIAIVSLASSGYFIKNYKDLTNVFKTINKELGEDKISEFSSEEDKQYDVDLENTINNAHKIRLQLENEKKKLENILETSSTKEVMDNFIKNLNNNELKCDREPVIKEDLETNDEFIDEQVKSYVKKLTPEK